jgi:two-component system, chemotaxis family, chemotaxis protein CheY
VKKVLIVEDSDLVRTQVRRMLALAGYQAIDAGDGADGLEKLKHEPDIALILCDVHMPRMGGIDMLGECKMLGLVTPFVVLTSEVLPAAMRLARELGAKAWVIKPVKADVLLSVVTKLIGPA